MEHRWFCVTTEAWVTRGPPNDYRANTAVVGRLAGIGQDLVDYAWQPMVLHCTVAQVAQVAVEATTIVHGM